MAGRALVVAVEHTDIAAFPDRPGLIAGAVEFIRWLVDPRGGALDKSDVRLLCAPAGGDAAQARFDLPRDLEGVVLGGPPTVTALKLAAAEIREAGQRCGRGELVFYWAGHGAVERGEPTHAQTLALFDDNRVQLYNLMIALLEWARPTRLATFVDACRNRAEAGQATQLGNRVVIPVEAEDDVLPDRVAVFHACCDGDRAMVEPGAGGKFTLALVSSLREYYAGAQPEPWLSGKQLTWLHEELARRLVQLGQRPVNLLKGWSQNATTVSMPEAPDGIGARDWEELLRLVEECDDESPVDTRVLKSIYLDALEAGIERAPSGAHRLLHFVRHIAEFCDVASGQPPRALTYLFALTKRERPTDGLRRIAAWLETKAWFGWIERLVEDHAARQAVLDAKRVDGAYLIARIRLPERAPRAGTRELRYRYDASIDLHGDVRQIADCDERPLTLSQIKAKFTGLIDSVQYRQEAETGGPDGVIGSVVLSEAELEDLSIEFIVPRSLLGHPFGRWRLNTGAEIRDEFPVVLRDGDRWWERGARPESVRHATKKARKRLRETGGQLAARHTAWIRCEQINDRPNSDIAKAPYVMFAFPATRNADTTFEPTFALSAVLQLGAVAVLWPDEECPINHRSTATVPADLDRCAANLLPAAFEARLTDPGCDLRPRFFVRDLRRCRDAGLPPLNLLYDDDTRRLGALIAPR